jgi:uncharacterized protein (TIGR02246 family)
MEGSFLTAVLRSDTDTSSIEAVIGGLIRAWNDGDALAFAGFFEEDADLVNIHGMHLHGRQAIAGLYDMLFRSIFAASSTEATINTKRFLSRSVAVVHARVELSTPRGSMAGTHDTLSSVVMVRGEGTHWMVASLHNTLVTSHAA